MMPRHYISPRFTTDDFPDGPKTIEDKLKVFEDRVRGWQLGIALQTIERDRHSGFAVLHIVTSYFEMIAMYIGGPALMMGSKRYFRAGVMAVFPELAREKKRHVRWFVNSLYKNVRCGLYHEGMTRTGIVLTGDTTQPYRFEDLGSGTSRITINPKLLVEHLCNHFDSYVKTIEDASNASESANFEAMFDCRAPASQPTHL